mmetsp:Transcript_18734/g.53715  ORF Transcript_18734/g.53715 Transcript_18734/m.53715 type:complete len:170 (-) Transcript_18734:1431-1940(-)
MARHSTGCWTPHFEKERNTRMMSTGRSSFVRVDKKAAAALNKSVCTSRISDKIASSAVSCTGAKLLCLANAARPTDAKNLCSEKPTETKAARQQFSSWGAKVINRDDISTEAALKKALENSWNRGDRVLSGRRVHDASVLVKDVNCELVNSFNLGSTILHNSAIKSPFW